MSGLSCLGWCCIFVLCRLLLSSFQKRSIDLNSAPNSRFFELLTRPRWGQVFIDYSFQRKKNTYISEKCKRKSIDQQHHSGANQVWTSKLAICVSLCNEWQGEKVKQFMSIYFSFSWYFYFLLINRLWLLKKSRAFCSKHPTVFAIRFFGSPNNKQNNSVTYFGNRI